VGLVVRSVYHRGAGILNTFIPHMGACAVGEARDEPARVYHCWHAPICSSGRHLFLQPAPIRPTGSRPPASRCIHPHPDKPDQSSEGSLLRHEASPVAYNYNQRTVPYVGTVGDTHPPAFLACR
jgi:hypothetical protein